MYPPVVRCEAGHGARGRGGGFPGTRLATDGLPAPGPLFSLPLIRWNPPCRQFRWAAVHHLRVRGTHAVRGVVPLNGGSGGLPGRFPWLLSLNNAGFGSRRMDRFGRRPDIGHSRPRRLRWRNSAWRRSRCLATASVNEQSAPTPTLPRPWQSAVEFSKPRFLLFFTCRPLRRWDLFILKPDERQGLIPVSEIPCVLQDFATTGPVVEPSVGGNLDRAGIVRSHAKLLSE